MRDHVFLYVNGQPHHVRGGEAFETLADYLRRKLRLTGTKVVCAEGDCGSCSVMVGRAVGDGINYQVVCSCILTVGQLDGAHVVSVEGLGSSEKLNAIQRAFVGCHGAQCGYCTPGFVVALQGVMENTGVTEREGFRRELVGNLCRCTGYESILESACLVKREEVTRVEERFESARMVGGMREAEESAFEVWDGPRVMSKPVTFGGAAGFKGAHPGATVLSGGTDLGVAVNKKRMELGKVLLLSQIAGSGEIGVEGDGGLSMGPRASVEALEKVAGTWLPSLAGYLVYFGSPPIKRAATVGGNIITGSPIGDLLPALMVLEARLELTSTAGRRVVGINEFYVGYRKSLLRGDELLTRVRVPAVGAGARTRFYKVSKRKDLDISAVSAAFYLREGEVRIAFGGVAATPVRMRKAEAFLSGKAVTEAALLEAGRVAAEEVTPISDVRGSAEYRRALVENLFAKLAYELGASAVGSR